MTGLTFFVMVLLVWALGEFAIGCWIWNKRRAIRKLIRIERTRGKFAEVRNLLLREVYHDRLQANSATFQIFYCFTTEIMRNNDRHPEIGKNILHSLIQDNLMKVEEQYSRSDIEVRIDAESKEWSNEIKGAVKILEEAINCLIIDSSMFLRVFISVAKVIRPLQEYEETVRKEAERRQPELAELEQLRRQTKQLALA